MPSLRAACTDAPVVVLDAASALVQVGLLSRDGSGRWETSPDESGVAVFECFSRLGVAPAAVGTWVYCDGPGSILGIRTVAMALRTWRVLSPRPIYGYCSLAVVAHALARPEIAVIADARRETWHHFQIETGLRRVDTAQLTGSLVMPEHFRHWAALPAGVKTTPYQLSELLPQVWDADLLLPTEAPDAFLHEEPSYVTWTPRIHRAPGT